MLRYLAGTLLFISTAPALALDAEKVEMLADNIEMTKLFEADQDARKSTRGVDWDKLNKEDAERRVAIQKLLDEHKLHTGNDYYHAAFIFQHGGKPEHYLKAHALAIIATEKGRQKASWIAAATLDRYLQAIGQKQIYGTQYSKGSEKPWTQEPYDRTVINDTMREAMGVPVQAKQDERLKILQAANP